MTLAADCAWAAARAAAIAIAAVLAATQVRALLSAQSRRVRRATWAAHLVPALTPALLVGYAYASFSLSLVREPAWNHALPALYHAAPGRVGSFASASNFNAASV